MESSKTSNGGIAHLTQNVSGMSLSSGDGDWEKVNKKNKSKGGNNVARQWGSQSSAPNAWGPPDTTPRFGNRGNNGSGQALGNMRNSTDPYSGAMGRGGRSSNAMATAKNVAPPLQHGWNWAARVGSSQVVATHKDENENEKDDLPHISTSEEEDDDDFSDDEDDDLLIDEFVFEESASTHESQKKHRMFKVFFETLDKLSLEEVNDPGRQWHCPACQGGPGAIDWYKGLQPLAAHARTKNSKRVKLHRLFAQVLEEELRIRGTSVLPAGESFGNWDGLKTETKDHVIVWPPVVIIFNTKLEKGDNDKWLGMGSPELMDYFSSYAPQRAKHAYGPQGHRGLSILVFENSAVGYMEAERLHKHFLDQGTGKQAWEQKRWMFNHGGKRQLFGCLATKDDMEVFNQHCQGKQRFKYEMRSYNETVVSQMKQMSEDNQQLTWFKQKVVKEQRHSKALEESLTFMSEKLRKTVNENCIVKQRSKMHHQQNQEEMNFQDQFFREQMKQIEEGLSAKENNFEHVQQEERKKVEELPSYASNAEERKRRMEEVESFHKSQDREMSQFVIERDELVKQHEESKETLKKKFLDAMLDLEKKFDANMTLLMESYAPGSTQGDA